jgi:hypothetical protein
MKHFARIAQVQEYDNVFIVDRRRWVVEGICMHNELWHHTHKAVHIIGIGCVGERRWWQKYNPAALYPWEICGHLIMHTLTSDAHMNTRRMKLWVTVQQSGAVRIGVQTKIVTRCSTNILVIILPPHVLKVRGACKCEVCVCVCVCVCIWGVHV